MPLERLGEVRLAPAESIRRPGLISIISAQLAAKTMLMVPHCRWLTGGLAYKIFSHWDRLLRRGGKGGEKVVKTNPVYFVYVSNLQLLFGNTMLLKYR